MLYRLAGSIVVGYAAWPSAHSTSTAARARKVSSDRQVDGVGRLLTLRPRGRGE